MNIAAKPEQQQNAVVRVTVDTFRQEILPPEKKSELFSSLPSHVRPERFERNLVNALMQNPDLMLCDPRLVFREVSKAAALGLYLDPQLGEAYLIVGWNGKAKRKEPQLRIGYRGLIKLGRQSGEISMIYAHEVHKNDVFECNLGDHKSLTHKPDVFGDRGDIVGYYAVVKYSDGESDFEPLTVAQAHAIRDRSDGWKAYKDGKIKSTPWSTDEVEMSKKTVIRRLTKRIPQSPELAEAINIEDAAEHSELRPGAIMPPAPPPAPPVAGQIAAPNADEAMPMDGEIIDQETGEVIEAEDDTAVPPPPPPPKAEKQQEFANPEDILKEAEQRFAGATDEAEWEEVRTEFAHLQETLFPPDWDRLVDIMQRHHERVTMPEEEREAIKRNPLGGG